MLAVADAVLFGDTTSVVCQVLAAALAEPVHARVPNPRPSTFVRVERTGGPAGNLVSDGATIVVESWATTEADAHDLAQLCRRALRQATATVVGGVTVYRVTEVSGPGRLPDPESDQARYTQTFTVRVRGA